MGFILEKLGKIDYYRYDKLAPDLKGAVSILSKCDADINRENTLIVPLLDDKNIANFDELREAFKGITHIIVDSLVIANHKMDSIAMDNIIFINTNFEGSSFTGLASFNNSVFYTSKFDFVNFNNATFNNVHFKLITSFNNTTFNSASFCNVIFYESTEFDHSTFLHLSTFNDTIFNFKTTFNNANFNLIHFENTTFNHNVTFDKATFNQDATFDNVLFNKIVSFKYITANAAMNFPNALLNNANFSNSIFHNANFKRAKFVGNSSFGGTKFHASNFYKATFDSLAIFDNSIHVDNLDFKKTKFNELSIINIRIAKCLFMKQRKIATLKLGGFYFVNEGSLKTIEDENLILTKYNELLDVLQDARSFRKTCNELSDIYAKMDNQKGSLLFKRLKDQTFNTELKLQMKTGPFNNVKYNLILIKMAIIELLKICFPNIDFSVKVDPTLKSKAEGEFKTSSHETEI